MALISKAVCWYFTSGFLYTQQTNFTILHKPLTSLYQLKCSLYFIIFAFEGNNFWGCETTLSHQFHTCSCWRFILQPSEQSFTPRVIRTWTRMNNRLKIWIHTMKCLFHVPWHDIFPRFWWKFMSPVFPWRVTFIEKIQGAV